MTRRVRAARPRLRALADRLGIVAEYLDQAGAVRRTSNRTREALLSAMGFDAPTEDAALGWLDELDHEERAMILDPVRVVEHDDRTATRVRVRVPPLARNAEVELVVTEESGRAWRVRRAARGVTWLELPGRVPCGYHTIQAIVRTGTGAWRADQSFIVVPRACIASHTVLRDRKVVGVVANLYSVRREGDWGVGDLTTLTRLVEWSAARGSAFLGINPLHALFNRGLDVSPYGPVSRLFRNHIYMDVERVPELARSPEARALLAELGPEIGQLRRASQVDYDRVIALKERVLAVLHRTFARGEHGTDEERAREYRDFVRARDPELTQHATWMAIAAQTGTPDWRAWPAAFHDPRSPEVAAFRNANAERVDFHCWVQFELHRQLGDAARRAHALGMPIGVYQDLAIGTSPGGSDTWSYADLFLEGACVGAPPDPYATSGQNWGLPPTDPRALRLQRYRYWIQLLRRAFEHSGALRIDHVMGLFRQFWIPQGRPGREGAYVTFPARDLLGILALESARHSAIVIGEDLGTVPPEVPPALRRWAILSSRVLHFERDRRGFRPASRYPAQSLATANTHDLVPLAGFWSGRDVALRKQLGLVASPAEIRRAARERVADKRALLARVGLREPREGDQSRFGRRLTAAVHDFLCSTRADLVGLSLDDLIGEEDPVNVPGVGCDRYPSWRRRTRMTVEEIARSVEVDDAMRCGNWRAIPAGDFSDSG